MISLEKAWDIWDSGVLIFRWTSNDHQRPRCPTLQFSLRPGGLFHWLRGEVFRPDPASHDEPCGPCEPWKKPGNCAMKAARFSEIKGKTWDIYGKLMKILYRLMASPFFDRSPRLIRRPHVQMSRALRPCLSAQAWCESCGNHGLQIAKAQTMEDLQEPRPSHQHLATACVTERCMLQSLVRNQECTWKATGKIMSFCMEIKRTWSCYGCSRTRLRKFIPKWLSR